jgi:hypothetical protein
MRHTLTGSETTVSVHYDLRRQNKETRSVGPLFFPVPFFFVSIDTRCFFFIEATRLIELSEAVDRIVRYERIPTIRTYLFPTKY